MRLRRGVELVVSQLIQKVEELRQVGQLSSQSKQVSELDYQCTEEDY